MFYHLHIYRVDKMAEVEVDAATPEEARGLALSMPRGDLNWTLPDCSSIAMTFGEATGIDKGNDKPTT